jgi:nucleotide-binding universal stress UspA family protein
VIIFEERFKEGAWAYALLIPILYFGFGFFRERLGAPSRVGDRLGLLLSSSYLPPLTSQTLYADTPFQNILVPLDRSPAAEQATNIAGLIGRCYGSKLTLLSVVEDQAELPAVEEYLGEIAGQLRAAGHEVATVSAHGEPAACIGDLARTEDIDLVVMTTHGRTRWKRWLTSSVTSRVIYQTTPPLIVVRPTEDWHSTRTRFSRLLVALDGSAIAEQVLPYVHEVARRFDSHVTLLSVQEGGDSEESTSKLRSYLARLEAELKANGISTSVELQSSAPTQAILHMARDQKIDALMLVSHGRGGVERQDYVKLGSVVDSILQHTPCPVFLVSALPEASASDRARYSRAPSSPATKREPGLPASSS